MNNPTDNRSMRRPGGFQIRPAKSADAQGVAGCVKAAYGRYTERTGEQPVQVQRDYAQLIGDREVLVAHIESAIVGVLLLARTEKGFLLDEIAVVPACQGQGIGRALLEMAERAAVHQGFGSIYALVHPKMTESVALFTKIGYAEYENRSVDGDTRVYLRKRF